jgi:hypothetical protein
MSQTGAGKPTDEPQGRYRNALERFLRAMGDGPVRANLLAATVRHVRPSLRQRPPADAEWTEQRR